MPRTKAAHLPDPSGGTRGRDAPGSRDGMAGARIARRETAPVDDSLQLDSLKQAGAELARRPLETDRAVRLATELGNALVTAGWPDAGLALAERVVAARPGNLDGLDLITRAALGCAAPEAALGAVETRLQQMPGNERLRRMHASLVLAHGRPADAADILDGLAQQKPGDIPLRFEAARACVQASEWSRAIAHLDIALQRRPRNLRGQLDRILALERSRGPDAAIEGCHAAVAAHGPHPQLALRLGQLLAAAGRDGEAAKVLADARQAFPSDTGVVAAYGALLRKIGERAQALRLYDETLESMPDFAGGWLAKAGMASEDGDLEAAVRTCEDGLTHVPAHHGLRLHKADLCRRLGRFDEAMTLCREALRDRPDDIGARMKLAASLVDLHRLDEADGVYREVLHRQPRHDAALLARVNIAKRLGQPEAGLALLHERLGGARSC